MNYFTASNGVKVVVNPDGSLGFVTLNTEHYATAYGIRKPFREALREFFRAEEDGRLGRWRWPVKPDYVVYPDNEGWVHVLRENNPLPVSFSRGLTEDIESDFRRAARDYFETHPEPKPWHDAKPGEVWVLTCDDEVLGGAYVAGDHTFVAADHGLPINSSRITAGRRIYPEVTS